MIFGMLGSCLLVQMHLLCKSVNLINLPFLDNFLVLSNVFRGKEGGLPNPHRLWERLPLSLHRLRNKTASSSQLTQGLKKNLQSVHQYAWWPIILKTTKQLWRGYQTPALRRYWEGTTGVCWISKLVPPPRARKKNANGGTRINCISDMIHICRSAYIFPRIPGWGVFVPFCFITKTDIQ